jgi:hypothetical protein
MNTTALLVAVASDLNAATAVLLSGGSLTIEQECSLMARGELVNRLVDLCLDRPAAEEKALMEALGAVERFALAAG